MTAGTEVNLAFASTIEGLPADTIVVIPFFEGDDAQSLGQLVPSARSRLELAAEHGELRSRLYRSTFLHPVEGQQGFAIVGAGVRDAVEPIILLRVYATGTRHASAQGYDNVALLDREALHPRIYGTAAAEGAVIGAYDSGIKKTREQEPHRLETVALVTKREAEARTGAKIGLLVGENKNYARDLVNTPANLLTPSDFANRARDMARDRGLEAQVLDEDAMFKLGMGSLLGVAAGSAQRAQLIVLRYGDPDASVRLALCGKGLTFDSGGLSLKTHEGMETMKGDMGGGAAVVAGMKAIAELKPQNISVTAYVGATENMPSGEAMKPGDVLTALNGETIEVLNTDAEGRLVLADLLAYASQQGATHIVDFATLTGAAVVALGHEATLTVGRPQQWGAEVVEAAHEGLERAWLMPLYDEYRRNMDSEIADIKNTGGRWGGALNAAAFLSDFVSAPNWAHMDIAGPSFYEKGRPYAPFGGTGEGVGTIVSLVQRLASRR